MSITINDKRGSSLGLEWNDLLAGHTYTYDSLYLMKTDEDAVINLDNGVLLDQDNFRCGLQFYKFKARLEIE